MKLEALKSVEIKAIEFPDGIPVPPFADSNKLSDRMFGAFCRINPELSCMQDETFIKRAFECIAAAGGRNLPVETKGLKLPTFVEQDKEIKKWRNWYAEEKEKKAAYRKANKEKIAEENKAKKEKYGKVLVNGVEEPLQSWQVEPEGFFFGRGDSPLSGYWKMSTDILLNTNSKNLPIALFTEDGVTTEKPYKWNVKWNPDNHAAATYNVLVGIPTADGKMKKVLDTKYKMIAFGASSSVKKEGREKKFAAGAELGKSYKKVLDVLEKDFNSKKIDDLGTTIAVFFLFEKGIRIGGKKETKNGTKGLLSLVWGKDVKRVGNKIKFDFYGKDSVRDLSEIETVYAEKIEEHWSKFKQLNTDKSDVKEYVANIVPSLDGIFTPKLARTAVAAYTAQIALEEMEKKYKITKDSTIAMKKLALDEATMMVARRLNHQKGVNKVAEEKRKAKFKESEAALKEREAKMKEAIAKKEEKIKLAKKKGDKEKVKALKEQIDKSKAKLEQAKLSLSSKEKNQNFTSSTAKGAYIDPSILADWCNKVDLPIEKVYSKAQLEQFENFFKED